jgi:hypothetical protein
MQSLQEPQYALATHVSCGVWHPNPVPKTPSQSQPAPQSWLEEQSTVFWQYPTGSAQTHISFSPQSASWTQP